MWCSVVCVNLSEWEHKHNNNDNDDDNNNNNNNFFFANILEDQAQWRDKTRGLNKLVIVKQWMDEEARRLRRIDSI